MIETASAKRRFRVEVAQTRQQQATGMMFRRSAPANTGMLFPFEAPQIASFWMRNTLIPLDIMFIRADGTITNIETGVPLSLAAVRATEPVSAVLEIGGGEAARLGIQPGDRIVYHL